MHGAITIGGWISSGVLTLTLVAIASLAPVVKSSFHLPFAPAALAFVPVLAFGIVGSHLHRTKRLSAKGSGVAVLVNSAALQCYFAYLAALSSGTGAAIWASLLVFTAAYHGHLFRVTLRAPFLLLATSAAVACALVVRPTHEHVAIFSIAGPVAAVLTLIVGSFAARADELQEQSDRLRAALTAQMMSERSAEAQRLANALVDVLSHNHDIDNALAVARINADLLEVSFEEPTTSTPPGELREMVVDIRDSLDRVKGIFHMARQVGKASVEQSSQIESVDAAAVGRTIVETARKRFRETVLELVIEDDVLASSAARVRGGALTLERIVENLVVNACEGNGVHAARRAVVRVGAGPDGCVTLSVVDDGPGFKAELLGREIVGFETTKRTGSGLGLYTVERLVRASGGVITRANGPSGGAIVTVKLARGELH